jgi:flagellar capping protein FliD
MFIYYIMKNIQRTGGAHMVKPATGNALGLLFRFGAAGGVKGGTGRPGRNDDKLGALYGRPRRKISFDYASINRASDMKSAAKDLKAAIGALRSDAVYNRKTAVSTDTDTVSVSASNKSGVSQTLSVEVLRLAAGQTNEGAKLAAFAPADVTAGDHTVRVSAGDRAYDISFRVSSGDTNAGLQQKMADAINARGIGVTASITNAADKSTLRLTADAAGDTAAARFAITDIRGDAVVKTGIGEVTQQAQDARYTVNGEEKTSAGNDVTLTDGVTATLKKVSAAPVQIRNSTDTDAIIAAVTDMTEKYNRLLSGDGGNDKLTRELSMAARGYASSLGRVGIGVSAETGQMTIDADNLRKAAADGGAKAFFTQDRGKSYGFASRLYKAAERIGASTFAYLKQPDADGLYTGGDLYGYLNGSAQAGYLNGGAQGGYLNGSAQGGYPGVFMNMLI